MGKDEVTLLEIAYRQNGPVPQKIRDAPELLPGLMLYVEAFNTLIGSRATGQAMGNIPYSEISLYVLDYGISDREEFIHIIQEMDRFYVKWQTNHVKKKMEAEAAASKTKSRTPPTRTRSRK